MMKGKILNAVDATRSARGDSRSRLFSPVKRANQESAFRSLYAKLMEAVLYSFGAGNARERPRGKRVASWRGNAAVPMIQIPYTAKLK